MASLAHVAEHVGQNCRPVCAASSLFTFHTISPGPDDTGDATTRVDRTLPAEHLVQTDGVSERRRTLQRCSSALRCTFVQLGPPTVPLPQPVRRVGHKEWLIHCTSPTHPSAPEWNGCVDIFGTLIHLHTLVLLNGLPSVSLSTKYCLISGRRDSKCTENC